MDTLKKISPEWPLRLGLGFMYLYSSYDIFYNTQQWKSYIPPWLFHLITPVMQLDLFLKIQAMGEFILALLLVTRFFGTRGVRIAALLAILEMAFILLFVGIDRITFRDIGLLGGALALFFMQSPQYGTSITQS